MCASPVGLCHCDAESRDSESGGDRYLIRASAPPRPRAPAPHPGGQKGTATAARTGDLNVHINMHKAPCITNNGSYQNNNNRKFEFTTIVKVVLYSKETKSNSIIISIIVIIVIIVIIIINNIRILVY